MPLRVLVVHDDPIVRTILVRYLGAFFAVRPPRGGMDAVRSLT